MKIYFTFFMVIISLSMLSQKNDYVWYFGYSSTGGTSTNFGRTVIDFNSEPPEIYKGDYFMRLTLTNSNICDEDGNLQFYTNGVEIGNTNNTLIENGNGLNPSEYSSDNQNFGLLFAHTALALPIPESDHLYNLFHLSINYPHDDISWHSPVFYYTKVDMNQNNGAGLVIEKNIPLITDTLMTSGVTGTKHANGRDWWVVIQEYNSNRFYKILQTSDSVFINDIQPVGDTIFSSVSQAVFSLDGSKYVKAVQNGGTDHINIYDFDRCTGDLSNHVGFKISNVGNGTGIGVIISPNSRYLYISQFDQLWQYDLWAADIEASQLLIDEWDGFFDDGFPTTFSSGLLAPNHKIYLSTSHSTKYLHVIDRPNEYGEDCRFLQHEVNLPTWNEPDCMPNYPHFRLGPIDGSLCDTLGIDNHPVAAWVHDLDLLAVKFTDYSYYEPTEWFWDFGDTQTSSEQQPTHEYAEEGIYEVCLTVSNEFDLDTLCKMVEVIISGVEDLEFGEGIAVFPNPSSGEVQLKMEKGLSENGWFVLYDNFGKVVFEREILKGSVLEVFDFQGFGKGMYFYEIREGDLKVGAGKLVLIE